MGNFATLVVDHRAFPRLARSANFGKMLSTRMAYGEDQGDPSRVLKEQGWAILHYELCNRNVVPICFEGGSVWAVNFDSRAPQPQKNNLTFFTLFGISGDLSDVLECHNNIGGLLWEVAIRQDAFPINSSCGPSDVFYVGPMIPSFQTEIIMNDGGGFWSLSHKEVPMWSEFELPQNFTKEEGELYGLLTGEVSYKRSPPLASRIVQRLLKNFFRKYYG